MECLHRAMSMHGTELAVRRPALGAPAAWLASKQLAFYRVVADTAAVLLAQRAP